MQKKSLIGASFCAKNFSTTEDGNYATFSGYASDFTVDEGQDILIKGAFLGSLAEHKERDNRMVRMFSQHDYELPIGGFPVDKIFEDKTGLFVEGQINLNTQRGREVSELMQQGVMSDLSIGGFIGEREMKDGLRQIKEFKLMEISVVSEPMNRSARIVSKAVTPFLDLELADREREWDADEADARIREFTGSEDSPSDTYRDAFFFYDENNAGDFSGYKLPYADIIDGEMKAVPRGIFSAASVLEGGLGELELPEGERPDIVENVIRYYDKMELPHPFEDNDTEGATDEDEEASEELQAGFSIKSRIKSLSSEKQLSNFLRKRLKISASERDVLMYRIKQIVKEKHFGSRQNNEAAEISKLDQKLNELLSKIS